MLLIKSRQVRKEATVDKAVRACSDLLEMGIANGDKMYKVLARKYRPSKLDEIVGQDVAIRILKNAIKSNRLHHAILLSGPMGVGKTSTARIIAKSLNCENGPTVEPCNQCESCISISKGKNIDVLEIDGASNRKVDDARSLIESIKYPPLKSRYKIYIIDEVHMFTIEAFNAMLKTIEEPPDYVKFIFATTALEKIPDTILSRCQIITLKKISKDLIKEKLKKIAENEGVSIGDSSIDTIAFASFGSMRVAEGYLDRCMAYSPKKITGEDVFKVVGVTDEETVGRYFDFIADKNIENALLLIKSLYEQDINFEIFSQQCIDYLLKVNSYTIEHKTALLNIFYNALIDIKQKINPISAINIATHKAVSLCDLERVEDVIQKLSDGVLKKETAEEESVYEDFNRSNKKQELKKNSAEDSWGYINAESDVEDAVKLVLKEFEGKIITVEKLNK